MYIRRARTYTTRSGEPSYSYRLVENTREEGRARQRHLPGLGADWKVPQEQWGQVTQRVEELLRGQIPLVLPDEAIEGPALDIVRQLRSRGLAAAGEQEPEALVKAVNTLSHNEEPPRSACGVPG